MSVDRRRILKAAIAAPVLPGHRRMLHARARRGGARSSGGPGDRARNYENARFWPDTQEAAMVREAVAALAARARRGSGGGAPCAPANFLAVSGGGDDGAFGAGLAVRLVR